MSRCISLFIAAFLLAGCLSSCGKGGGQPAVNSGKIQIVTTIFPEYDWVMNILGENPAGVQVTLLLDRGVDFHSYQLTADDILKISACDLFVYVGGESDRWAEDVLQEAVNQEMVTISLLDVLGDSVREEEIREGMQAEEHDHNLTGEEENDGQDLKEVEGDEEQLHEEEEPEYDEPEYDEHVWLSLRNAAVCTADIAEALIGIDPDHADIYKKNSEAYIEKLYALSAEYQAAVDGASFHTLLFGDRFPFRYLTDDYGLDYYAAFSGCSAETEASFETVTFLSRKVDELGLPAVMTIEGTDHRIAETIVQNTQAKNQQILTLDSMQSTTGKDIQGGSTYLSVMENNLAVLKDALR